MTLFVVQQYISTSAAKKEAETRAFIMTQNGTYYATSGGYTLLDQEIECKNHAKSFVKLMYAFEESTYDDNTAAALELIGKDGEFIYADYEKADYRNTLKKLSLKLSVTVDSVFAYTEKEPFQVVIFARQTQESSTIYQQKYLHATMEMRKVARTDRNPCGLLIEKFSIKNSRPVE